MLNDIEMENVLATGRRNGKTQAINALQQKTIIGCELLPALRPAHQVWQLDRKDGSLKAIKPTVDTFNLMVAFG
jgi:hypothetical protein